MHERLAGQRRRTVNLMSHVPKTTEACGENPQGAVIEAAVQQLTLARLASTWGALVPMLSYSAWIALVLRPVAGVGMEATARLPRNPCSAARCPAKPYVIAGFSGTRAAVDARRGAGHIAE